MKAGDAAAIQAATADLTKASHQLAEALYSGAAGGAGAARRRRTPTTGAGGKGEGDVVDAEVVDEK